MLSKFRSLPQEQALVQLDGNVTIDPSAAIAPGVIISASADSRIAIGAGVCIGAGTIVRASGGSLEIGAGVCLGRDVLIVGSGRIGRDACLGAETTAISPQIAAGTIVPPHSLLGDRSRTEVPASDNHGATPASATEDFWGDRPASAANHPLFYKVPDRQHQPESPSTPPGQVEPPVVTTALARTGTNYVAGRAQFDRIKRALFPHSGSNDDTAQT